MEYWKTITFSVSRCNVKIWSEVLTWKFLKTQTSYWDLHISSLLKKQRQRYSQDVFLLYGKVAPQEAQGELSTELVDSQMQ